MTLKMKRSAVAGKIPTTAQLDLGELAINTHDGRLFLKRDNGAPGIVRMADAAWTVTAGAGLTGGGDLTADRSLAADIATQAEAEAGTAADKLMTPQRTAQAIAALAAGGGLPVLSAGEAIRSRIDAAWRHVALSFATRHQFSFLQFGTIRVAAEVMADTTLTGAPVYLRIVRRRTALDTVIQTWAKNDATWQAYAADVAVQPGDTLFVQISGSSAETGTSKSGPTYSYNYPTIRNLRFQTGGETLYPGSEARLEGNNV